MLTTFSQRVVHMLSQTIVGNFNLRKLNVLVPSTWSVNNIKETPIIHLFWDSSASPLFFSYYSFWGAERRLVSMSLYTCVFISLSLSLSLSLFLSLSLSLSLSQLSPSTISTCLPLCYLLSLSTFSCLPLHPLSLSLFSLSLSSIFHLPQPSLSLFLSATPSLSLYLSLSLFLSQQFSSFYPTSLSLCYVSHLIFCLF